MIKFYTILGILQSKKPFIHIKGFCRVPITSRLVIKTDCLINAVRAAFDAALYQRWT